MNPTPTSIYVTLIMLQLVAATTSISPPIASNAEERMLIGVQLPAGWTAATLTFQTSLDGAAWADLWYAGAHYSIANAGGTSLIYVAFDPEVFRGLGWVRIISSTSNDGAVINAVWRRVT